LVSIKNWFTSVWTKEKGRGTIWGNFAPGH